MDDICNEQVENYLQAKQKLNEHYVSIKRLLLPFQNYSTGLFSCSSECYIRDSIYCSVAVWSLALAYRRIDDDNGRTYELEHVAVKCMRGVLYCYMRQASKVEKFKVNQKVDAALHSKFEHETGDAINKNHQHLQLDVVAMFVLYLVQMTESGLQIVFNTDEVAFVQNLVYYLERSYRVPDFGLWERGSKYNNGSCELHASSVGAAKAALESANGFNLFGKQRGAPWSVLWVDIDAHNRNRTVMDSLLPRESNSKNTDAALLPTVSFPFFAVDQEELRSETIETLTSKLEGRYGVKRFLGDGYKTAVEDTSRAHYQPAEIKLFNNIECEWPIFFVYLIIDGIVHDKPNQIKMYLEKLKPLLKVRDDGLELLPRFFYVSEEHLEAHRRNPGTGEKLCSFGIFEEPPVFLWGQAVLTIANLLLDQLITPRDLDPIRRYLPAVERHKVSMRYSTFAGVISDTVIQISLISESKHLQSILSTYGISTQTPDQVEPIQIWPSQELVKVYQHLGANEKLGISGRPKRPIGALGTCKVYRVHGRTVVCYPLMFDIGDFYMAFDTQTLIDELQHSLQFVSQYWRMPMRPLFIFLLREDTTQENRLGPILEVLSAFKQGQWDGIKVCLGRVQSFIASSVVEHLEFVKHQDSTQMDEELLKPFIGRENGLDDVRSLRRAGSSYSNLTRICEDDDEELKTANELRTHNTNEILSHLNSFYSGASLAVLIGEIAKREGLHFDTGNGTCYERLNKLCRWAAGQKLWSLVRYSASLCHKVVDSLAPSITSVLVHDKHITLGVFGHEEIVVSNPLPPATIKDILYRLCTPHDEREACLQQELVLYVGAAINKQPNLFEGMLQVRIGWLAYAMRLLLKHRGNVGSYKETSGVLEGEVDIHDLSPSDVKKLLFDVLDVANHTDLSWLQRRQITGALNKTPPDFYAKVWLILERSPDGFVINSHHLPQQPTLSDMGKNEVAWWKKVEAMFAGLHRPEFRQLIMEMLMVTAIVLERNPEIKFQNTTDIDAVVGDAINEYKKDKQTDEISEFCNLPSEILVQYMVRSVVQSLLKGSVSVTANDTCTVS
uniref:phosphorylase b kinase regulatory subunit beta n=1 Tax=Ciona intestinalis TaxID=7719 RepID=UPI000180C278|nr:phosphorylase b kinase regulatory subunit beta [Ciona intestinalis]|eukprot:XP_018669619.1 phosphorylase b kinase regulatory subunit beta [Ciona intestinalis]